MTALLLILSGGLIAGMYALARLAALEGVSPLALLYWQAVSGALIVSALALLSGRRPQLPLRHASRYAVAIVLGMSPSLLTSYGSPGGLLPGVVLAGFAPLLLFSTGFDRARSDPARLSPLGAASGILIALALVLDPIVASAHAIVLPGLSFTRLDWIFWGTSALSSAFYVTALALTTAAGAPKSADSQASPTISTATRSDTSKGCSTCTTTR
jgi:hypothetical protein